MTNVGPLLVSRSSSSSPAVSVSVGLPSVVVEQWGVWVECEVPPQGVVRSPLTLAYNIANNAAHTMELALTMQVSDAFMFAGHKEVSRLVVASYLLKMPFRSFY